MAIPQDLKFFPVGMYFEGKMNELRESALSLEAEKVESLAHQWIQDVSCTDEDFIDQLQEIMADITKSFPKPDERAVAVYQTLFEMRKTPLERLQRQSEENRHLFSSFSTSDGA